METKYDVVGIGNAMVDVISRATDAFVEEEGLTKGSMTLIEETRAVDLYARMGPGVEASGGSAANTVAGVASFGGKASYIGKVRADQLGDVFAHDMRASGVDFDVAPGSSGPATGRCLILVSPDAQRTMNTYLGISSLLEPTDVDPDLIRSAALLFCEGYLWDIDSAKAAILKAMTVATEAGRRVSFTLSDSFCVERHHAEFAELVAGPVDVLFANEAELTMLYETDDLDVALGRVGAEVELAFVTRGKRGSLVVRGDKIVEVPAEEIAAPVDTTGAGDQYAAGVLFGLARGNDPVDAARLGSWAAAEVIGHMGPRPLQSLVEFLSRVPDPQT